MFSLIDVLLQKPTNEIIAHLPLSELVSYTITGRQTILSPYLQCSIAIEKVDFYQAEEILNYLEIKNIDLQSLYNTAFNWSEEAIKLIQ